MKRRRLNGQEINAVKSKIAEGKNADQIATELGLPRSNVERLCGKNGVAPGGFAGATYKLDGGLDKALRAAGFGGSVLTPSGGSAQGGAPTPTPVTPEQIVALITMLNGTVCRTAATIYRVPLTESEMCKLVVLSKEEKDVIEMLAPYAAEYAPTIMSHIKPILAGGFVLAVLVSTGSRVYEIRERSPKVKEKRLTKAAQKAPKNKDVDSLDIKL